MAKVGDKYIIEIEGMIIISGKIHYFLKGTDKVSVNDALLERLEKYDCKPYDAFEEQKEVDYYRGLKTAWRLAGELFQEKTDKFLEDVFPEEWNKGGFQAVANMPVTDVMAKIKAYEDKKKEQIILHIGDEVLDYENGRAYIIFQIEESNKIACGIQFDSYPYIQQCFEVNGKRYKKTGRHFPEIAEFMKRIKEEVL